MDVPQLLLALGQQAQANLWSQYYAQHNANNIHAANGLDSKQHGQQAMEHMALQYWSALTRQQQDQLISQQSRPYPANPPGASGLGPDGLLLLSQLQHIPGGAQALASYLSSSQSLAAHQTAGQAWPAHGTRVTSGAWPYPQQSPSGKDAMQQQAAACTYQNTPYTVAKASTPASPPAEGLDCRAGSNSSASSEGDNRAFQAPVSRETPGSSPEPSAPHEPVQHLSSEWLASGLKCAKEKNRAAQRRFRERQKGLITAVKARADTLAKQVEEQRKIIEDLQNDNKTLQGLLQAKVEAS